MNIQLNYHHLRYFLAVADRGGIKAASEFLHVSPPTLSAQVRELEGYLETPLFLREGKQMVLTDAGRLVQRFAGRIFALGDEMVAAVQAGKDGKLDGIDLGIADTVPKLLVSRVLERVWREMPNLRVRILEGMPTKLFPALAAHQLDLVLANEPAPSALKSILFSRQTARFEIRLLVSPSLRKTYCSEKQLAGFPMLVPSREAALRRELEQWWEEEKMVPEIRAEFDDSAAMYELAAAGIGAAPAVGPVVRDVKRRYGLVELPLKTGLYEALYVLTAERQFVPEGARLIARFAQGLGEKVSVSVAS